MSYMSYIYIYIYFNTQSFNTKPMVRELDAARCAVRLCTKSTLTDARDNIWLNRSMATGQCLAFIVLDLAFIVRELQVRIPAHHSSSFFSLFPLHTPTPKERNRVIGLDPRRASEGLFAWLHPCTMQMQCNHAVLTGFGSRPRLEPQSPVRSPLVGCGRWSLSTLKEKKESA